MFNVGFVFMLSLALCRIEAEDWKKQAVVKGHEPQKCDHSQAVALWDALVVLIRCLEGCDAFV